MTTDQAVLDLVPSKAIWLLVHRTVTANRFGGKVPTGMEKYSCGEEEFSSVRLCLLEQKSSSPVGVV